MSTDGPVRRAGRDSTATHPHPSAGRYESDQFSFQEEDSDDVAGWLSFTQTRAGRRRERQELLRGRVRLIGAAAVAAILLVGLLAWSPWSVPANPDTGDRLLGGDRATVLLAVQGRDGASLFSGLLGHDRVARRGSAVAVPPELMLPVSGEGRVAVGAAFDRAGPTLTRDALGVALGVRVDGSWVLPDEEFARFVDRLGGVELDVDRAVVVAGRMVVPTGAQRLGGAQTIAYASYRADDEALDARSRRAQRVLVALASAMPRTFTGMRDLLSSLGVLGDAGLPVDRLAAVLSGVARDQAARRLGAGTLPVDPDSQGLDVTGAGALVQDLLGGRPRSSLGDVTPRVMVQLPGADPDLATEVRASLVGAGYEYVDGGRSRTRVKTSVVSVRVGAADARPVGEAVALTLGLDKSAVTTSTDVPVIADVVVVLGSDFGS